MTKPHRIASYAKESLADPAMGSSLLSQAVHLAGINAKGTTSIAKRRDAFAHLFAGGPVLPE